MSVIDTAPISTELSACSLILVDPVIAKLEQPMKSSGIDKAKTEGFITTLMVRSKMAKPIPLAPNVGVVRESCRGLSGR